MTTFHKAPHCRKDRERHASTRAEQAAVRGFEVSFLPTSVQVGRMRKITSAHLRHWGLWAMREAVTLVVSELVTNAVEHGQGKPVGLRVVRRAQELRVEVTDGNPAPARLRTAEMEEENGRGLLLVAALSKEWGVSGDGTMTWCSFSVTSTNTEANDVVEPMSSGDHLAEAASEHTRISGDFGLDQTSGRPLAWESDWPLEARPKGLNLFVRSALTSAAWAGDPSVAIDTAHDLASHAAKLLGANAKEFVLGLSIGVDEVVVVSVSVAVGADFGRAFLREPGLARVRAVAREIVWRPWRDGEGTTVSVRLPVGSRGGGRTPSPVPSVHVDC